MDRRTRDRTTRGEDTKVRMAAIFSLCAMPVAMMRRSAIARMCSNNAAAHARIVISQRNMPTGALCELANVDATFSSRVVTSASAEHERLVLSPVGSCDNDMDDVRKVGEAAASGAAAAFAMGATDLTLELDEAIEAIVHPVDGPAFEHAALVAQLGVLQRAYVPLQAREATPPKASPLGRLTLHPSGHQRAASAAEAIEAGRALARDIGSGDPERMAPLRLAEVVRSDCEAAGVTVTIMDDLESLRSDYPLLSAVARASIPVERHRPCVVRMEWSGNGETTRTLCIAGKGVTYDVGGADSETSGIRTYAPDTTNLSPHPPGCRSGLHALADAGSYGFPSHSWQSRWVGRWPGCEETSAALPPPPALCSLVHVQRLSSQGASRW